MALCKSLLTGGLGNQNKKKSGRKLESGNKILLFMCDVTRINTEFRDRQDLDSDFS